MAGEAQATVGRSTSTNGNVEEEKKPGNVITRYLTPELGSYFIAGGVAGAASRTVVSPLERLKIIMYVFVVLSPNRCELTS